MVKRQYNKSTWRMFVKQIVRLLSITAIFLVTISLVSGLGDVPGNIFKSIKSSYDDNNIHDLVIRSTEQNKEGIELVYNELNKTKEELGIQQIEKYYSFDIQNKDDDKHSHRYVLYDSNNNNINRLQTIEGNFPTNKNEVAIDTVVNSYHNYHLGDEITFPELFQKATIVGIVHDPVTIALSDEPSDYYSEDKPNYVNDIFYFNASDYSFIKMMTPPSLRITLNNRNEYPFSDSHKELLNKTKSNIELIIKMITSEQNLDINNFVTLTLFDNYGLRILHESSHKVEIVSYFFIVFFLFIAILVVYSTMSRLLDEDRPSIATLKTLGYSNSAISARYVLYVFISGLTGILLCLGPAFFVNRVILDAFKIGYVMKEIPIPIAGTYFYVLSTLTLVLSLILTIVKSRKVAKQKPVELLTHKAPKAGKKVLLEHIRSIWNRLSFKYKSTIRNIFLFKSRLLMTLLSIIGATVLIFASFGLLNKADILVGFESLRIVSLVVLIFSGSLCAIIIYNVTNINICERTREIATLMVLGYREKETTSYIYREIYIISIIGAIIGLPLGVLFVAFIFKYVDLGGIEDVAWWSYLVTPFVTIFFAFCSSLLLHKKIVKTDMNESLKVLE